MLYAAEDTITRSAARLRKLSETAGREPREIIEQFNSKILQEMEVTLYAVLQTIQSLFKCETLSSNEKFSVLDLFYDLMKDLLRNEETVDLGDIPVSLGKMKFLKNEKNVERAVIVYLKVIILLLKVVNTAEHRITIFKVFCTLFMSKSFISSTKCGYLIPPMFKEFLIEYPEFVGNLLDNQDKLIFCPPLLEVVLISCQKMDKVLSRLVILDFITRNSNRLVIMMQGKGFYEPFFFQMYIERETAPVSEMFPIFCKKSFLEYLFLDVSTRLTSKNIPQLILNKIFDSGTINFTRLLKEPEHTTECVYCKISEGLKGLELQRKEVQISVEKFNVSGDISGLVKIFEKSGCTEIYKNISRILRAHSDTNLFMLGKYLGKEENIKFLDAFCSSFDFSEYDILTALRVFLLSFNLPGEGQKIERIIYAFCKKYSEDGKQESETVLSIAMSIIVLNTSIHNVNTVKKISLDEFTQITLRGCTDVDVEYLESLYLQIKQKKLQVPVSNYVSAEVIEFLEQQSEADIALHPIVPHAQRYKYCGNCTRAVYKYAIEEYKISEVITARGIPSEIKSYIKACYRTGALEIVISTIKLIKDPYLMVGIIEEFKEFICPLWNNFLEMIDKIYQQKEESANTPSFFRNIFAFGKEPKKDKKDTFSDLIIQKIVEETRNIEDKDLMEMSNTLCHRIESGRTKILCKLAYIIVKNNTDRILIVGQLFKVLISTGGASIQEILIVCESSPFSNILQLLATLPYRPSKYITASVIAILQYVISILASKSPSIVEMQGIKEWMSTLITSEPFKLRNNEVIISIWETVEEISLRLDGSGFDGFEIFMKIRDAMALKSKTEVISNTRVYYKNINRVLLCLDILSSSPEVELKNEFISMISAALDKDVPGCLSILESCEHVLESAPEIQKRVEEVVYEKTQGTQYADVKYLKKIVLKMNLRVSPTKEIVDL